MNTKLINPPLVVKEIVNTYKGGYSPIVLICGRQRVSKTSKMFIFANWCSWLLFNKEWSWKENLIMDVDEFANRLKVPDEDNIFGMDEIQRLLGKKKVWSTPSIMMDDLITSQAYKHYILFMCLPKAWQLGTDHATSVNYVIPCHSRSLCQPYKVNTPYWDIALLKKVPKKEPLGHFYFDYKKEPIASAFKNELTHIDEFRKYIEVNLKEKILDSNIEQRNKQRKKEIERMIMESR